MRILSLDLDRYGPFTGRRLTFRPDARLHVILGPNEVGKSCALAAVTDLLFGTKETRYEFLHREAGLRLGAEIAGRDGRTLAFVRRRGGKQTLSDREAKTLPDDALVPFLGGLTRSVFCNAFGMNAEVLRKGAQEMLKSDGEVGATLFAAASGLRGFRDAADGLAEEAADIFTPTARKRRLNDLIRSYEEARTEARDTRLGTDAWRKLEAGIADAEARLATIGERRRALASETNRLKRLKSVAPILATLDSLGVEENRFPDLPDMDDATVAEFARQVRNAGLAAESLAVSEAAHRQAEADLAAVPSDEAVLPHEGAVEGLVKGISAYEKATGDLPRVRGEADGFERDLAAIAVRLGLPDAAAVEGRQPTDLARAHMKSLLADGRELAADRARHDRDLLRLRGELATLTKARNDRGLLTDPGPLRSVHEAVQPVLGEIGRRDALATEIARDATALDSAVQRLRPSLGVAANLHSLALPSGETVRRHGEAMAEAAQRGEMCRERAAQIRLTANEVARRMSARGAARDLPDSATLARTRLERDDAWMAVRSAAFRHPSALAGAELLDRASAFERANAAADALADRLVGDAQRAADQAADEGRMQELSDNLKAAETDLARAAQDHADAESEWRALWSPLGVEPLPPSEMGEWRSIVLSLAKQADALGSKQAELAGLVSRIEAVRPQLVALAGRLGLPDDLAGLDIALVEARVTERLRALAETWDAARDAATRIATADEAIAAGEAALRASAALEEHWQGRWTDALASLALSPATTLDGATAALDAWSEVPGLLRERTDRTRRIAGMTRDIERYELDARRVAVAAAAVSDRGAVETVRLLQERARAARDAAVLRGTHDQRRRDTERTRDAARLAAGRANTSVTELTERFPVLVHIDLATSVARLEERVRLRERLRTVRAECARASEGVLEAALREELATAHVDDIQGQLADLAAEEERLDHDGRVAFANRDRLQAERSRIELGTGSEMASARKSAAELDIRETARRYVVLKLGSLLLTAAIDRHRAGQQDPLVARAGLLFRDLTGNRYAGLDQAFDDKDQPILAGRCANGRPPVAVGDMSEGTRDQLFLALRLAYLEDYASRAEPAPFLGDDIFASFDDARTEHGLQALATLGETVQPILFTHHASVARAAERRLGPQVDLLELA